MRRDMIVTALLTFCLTATLFMIATSKSQEYDPWADLNEDGIIDIFDVVGVTGIYETTGDTTKNVNVMNWPMSTQVTVAWQRTVGGNTMEYNSSGFSQMHLIWEVLGLVGSENVTISVIGHMEEEGGGASSTFPVRSYFVTSVKDPTASVCIPVPSERFSFYFDFGIGTTASIFMAFYLTYA